MSGGGLNGLLRLALFALLLPLAGCDRIELPGVIGPDVGQELFGEGRPRIALVTGAEGVSGDYYASAWAALTQVQTDSGAGVAYLEARTVKDYGTRLLELQKKDADLVITFGANSVAAVAAAAAANPEIKYLVADALWPDAIPPNVLVLNYKGEEAGFVAGYLAGSVSRSHVLGFISSRDNALTQRYYAGFRDGGAQIRSNLEIMKGLAGDAPTRAHIAAMTNQMQANETDVIFHLIGSAAAGVMDAAAGETLWLIGSETDQRALNPDQVLCSLVKRHDLVLPPVIARFLEQGGGREEWLGFAEDAWEITDPDFSGPVGEELFSQMLTCRDQIVAGERIVPLE
ncbi:MAG: BMP family ABC transporter substrate-binding protein [Gracilibacteraceae bacterium]|nr:BMP family ABC transporter substrate-binding protein [Gracilibacteraceae bacterium]